MYVYRPCAYSTDTSADEYTIGCSGTSTGSDGNVYFTDKCYVDTSTTGCYASTEANLCTGACTVSAAVWYVLEIAHLRLENPARSYPVPCSLFPVHSDPIEPNPDMLFPPLPPSSSPSPSPSTADKVPNSSSKSSAPVCRTVLQFGTAATDPTTYTLYDCVPRGGKTRISLQNLFSLSSSVTPNPFIDPSYTLDGTTFVPIGGVVSKTGSSSSSTSNTVPGGNPTPVPDNGGGAGKTTTPKKKKTTGAIAGGVVGGLVAVGLIAGAVIWALIKKKQKARREAGAVQEVSHVTYVHDGK